MSIELVKPSNHLILCFPFSLCLQSFPASGSFPKNLLCISGGQSIGGSASSSILPVNIQGWFPLGLTDSISLLSKGLSSIFSSTTQLSFKVKLWGLSVQFSCSVESDSLQPHGLQHATLPCPSPTPRTYSNLCPSSQLFHPTISSSVSPFSTCLHSFPASGTFPVSQLCASGGQSIGVSASASVLSMNIQDWFPLGWISWISLQSKGLSKVFSNTTVQKGQFLGTRLSL